MPDNVSIKNTVPLVSDSCLNLSPCIWHGRGWSSDWTHLAMQFFPALSHFLMNEAIQPGKDGSS